MPILLQFGAGNIGRGFVAPTFYDADWQVIFVEVVPAIVAALRDRGQYRLYFAEGGQERFQDFIGFTVIDGRDLAAVAKALETCDLAATAVGLNNLHSLARSLAAGLFRRRRPLDVLVCENGSDAHRILREAVQSHLGDATDSQNLLMNLGFVRTSIGRMIPPGIPGGDLLDLRVEPYSYLPVERAAFRGPIPKVLHLDPVDDFDLVIAQKLYLHNLTHAILAYGGIQRGHTTICEAMADAALSRRCIHATNAVVTALGRRFGASAEVTSRKIVEDVLSRFRNRALVDPVRRVARDPWRKLAADDRLVGAARLCCDQGIPFDPIADAIVDACRYLPTSDEPGAARWLALSPISRFATACALPPRDPIMIAITERLAIDQRRQQAAFQMRGSGQHLRDDEVSHLEIADFGLGRFTEFGLAIHVYVNTKRCCAKELMMLPHQICPEHRHPNFIGDSVELGKEETFRVRSGEVYLHLPGPCNTEIRQSALARLPEDKRDSVTVFYTIHLKAGDQYTLPPETLHWFCAGPEGAVVSEFSTQSRDDADVFTDPAIVRVGS